MKIFIAILGLITGTYMLIDGLYVILKGKFIGPDRPGPWAAIFYKLNIDIFKMGPVFILYGLLWLTWFWAICTNQSWAFMFGLFLSICTLWYLPIGTLFSILIMVFLLLDQQKTG